MGTTRKDFMKFITFLLMGNLFTPGKTFAVSNKTGGVIYDNPSFIPRRHTKESYRNQQRMAKKRRVANVH